MRTLKKTLCLVLALVMMLGLCAINAAASSYTDDASIGADYREAVEVLSAIGVFNGKDDGSIGPQDSLTRVQGCYLICKMLGAPNGAGFASFSDVSAQDSPVVAYCQTLGIVDGYGDNTFHPYDPLTGAAFAKWCLVALGYNAAVEGMTGLGWIGNTQNLTTVAALAKDIAGYDPTATITREQAAQMCLNTLRATMVRYDGNVTVSGADGLNVTVNGNRSDQKNDSGSDYRYDGGLGSKTQTEGYMQFVEMYFPQLKLDNTVDQNDEDNLNTPLQHIWIYRGNETYRTLATPVVSYTGKTDKSTVSADLSGYYVVGYGAANEKMHITNAKTYDNTTYTNPAGTEVFLNGVQGSLTSYSGATATSVVTGATQDLQFLATKTLAEVISDLTANGRQVDFYATDDNDPNHITDIVITCYAVAKVRSITTNGNATTYSFTNAYSSSTVDYGTTRRTYSDAPADNSVVIEGNLAKDDYVTATYVGHGPSKDAPKVYVYATEMFTGVQTSRSSNNSVVIDGTTYNIAAGVSKDSAYNTSNMLTTTGTSSDFANSNTTSNFFMDKFGYLVHSDAVANGNFAFIVGATGKTINDVDGKTPEISVRAVLSDGTVGTYKVATEKKKVSAVTGTVLYSTDSNNGYYDNDGKIVTKTGETNLDVYMIKNTNILAGGNDVVDTVGPTGNSASDPKWTDNPEGAAAGLPTPDGAAKILMGTAYGYVYNYTLNAAGDTITLDPVSNEAWKGGFSDLDVEDGKLYTGETANEIVKGTASYARYDYASNRYAVPAEKASGTRSNAGGHYLLVNIDTPIIVYNSNSKTASAVTGLSNMPAATTNSAQGYFVGAANGDGDSVSLTARAIFIIRGGGVISSTREYLFIDATDYRVVQDDVNSNGDYYSYRAWHEDGTSPSDFYVKDVDNEYLGGHIGQSDLIKYSGLYTINDAGEVTGETLSQNGSSPKAHDELTAAEPYAHVWATYDNVSKTNKISVENNMIKVGSRYLYLDNAAYVYPYNGVDLDNCTGAYVVAEVVNNDLTGYVKTIYVY